MFLGVYSIFELHHFQGKGVFGKYPFPMPDFCFEMREINKWKIQIWILSLTK